MFAWTKKCVVLLTLGSLAACDAGGAETSKLPLGDPAEKPGEAAPQPAALVQIDSAMVSRCNQMMDFRYVALTASVTNTSGDALTLDAVDVVDATGELVEGSLVMESAVTLAAGETVRVSCVSREAVVAWPAAEATAHTAEATFVFTDGDGETVSSLPGVTELPFIEAWDGCDTFGPEPHPCRVVPAPE